MPGNNDLGQFIQNTSRAQDLINNGGSRSNSRIARIAFEDAVLADIFGNRTDEETRTGVFNIDLTTGNVTTNTPSSTNPNNPVDAVAQNYSNALSTSSRRNSAVRFPGLASPANNPTGVFNDNTSSVSYTSSRRYSVSGAGVGSPANTGGPVSTIGGQRTKIIRQFDRNGDGVVDDNETAYHLLRTRQFGSTRGISDLMSVNPNAQEMQQLIEYADISRDGLFQDPEVIRAVLAARRGDIQADQNILNLILADNTKLQFIKDAIAAIDEDGNGRVSDLEVLDTLLASKEGLVNIQDPVIRTILSTNVKFSQLEALSNNYNPNFNGVISNKDAFRILMSLRQGNFTSELASIALYVGNNPNAKSIEKSITLFDTNPDGTLSSSEFVNGILAVRKGIINGAEHQPFLQALSEFPDLANLLTAVEAIDKDANGVISDQEVVELAFALTRGELQFSQETLAIVLASNNRTQEIMTLFGRVDGDHTGTVSNQEVFNAITELKKGQISQTSLDVLSMIISQNPESQGIIDAIQVFDTDNNGIISGAEAVKGRIATRRGGNSSLNPSHIDLVLNSSADDIQVDAILNYLDPDANGLVSDIDLFDKSLTFERGASTLDKASHRDLFLRTVVEMDEDSNVRNALLGFDQGADGVIDDRDFANGFVKMERGELNISQELFDRIKTLNSNSQIIMSAFAIFDTDNNNQINAQEFVNNFTAAVSVNGQADPTRMGVVSGIIDILYPPAANLKQFSEALDANSDKRLSDQELINGLLALKRGAITNPGADIVNAVVATNANSGKIINLISQIDADNDGNISNTELANNLLKVRKGEFNSADLGFVQAILDTNAHYNDIQNLLNIFDKNQDGNISDLELFDGMIQVKSGAYQGMVDPAVVALIKSKNPNAAGLEALLTDFDPNGDGKIDATELIRGFLRVTSGQVQEPPAEFINRVVDQNGQTYGAARINEARTFVQAVDKDHNGQIADNEIIDMLLAQRNPNDGIQYNQTLVDGALTNNANSQNITALMNSIDVNGDGISSDAEVMEAMFASKNGHFANYNPAWVSQILATNPNLGQLQNFYNSVDTDDSNNGSITDAETVAALLKYKDSALLPEFQDPNNLSPDRLLLLDQILTHNPNFAQLQSQLNGLTTSSGGDLHEMMNTLLDIRSGAVTNNQYNLLISAMSAKLDQWQAQKDGVYTQKIANLLGEINGDAVVVDTGANSNEEAVANRIENARDSVDELEGDIPQYQASISTINSQLANPPMITITETNDKGEVSQRQVVDAVEVARLNTQLQATTAQLAQARVDLANAQVEATSAAESAYASLGISPQIQTLMQTVLDLAEGVRTDLEDNKSTAYSKMDELLDSYAQLMQVLPPNKENLLSLIFFDELKPVVTSIKNFINPVSQFDTSRDGIMAPNDALIIANFLNEHGSSTGRSSPNYRMQYDVNNDGVINQIDGNLVINSFNQ